MAFQKQNVRNKKKVYCDFNNDMQLNIWTFTQNGNKNAWN